MKKLILAGFILAALIAVYFLTGQPNHDKIVADAFSPYPNVISTATRSEGEANTQLDKLMALYDGKKYEEALGGFDNYLESDPPSKTDVQFYRGIIHLKMDNGGQAVDDFEAVVSNTDKFSDQAEWYLGLAYLKNNQKKEAADLIFKIADQEGHAYREQANTILNKIPYKKYMKEEIEGI